MRRFALKLALLTILAAASTAAQTAKVKMPRIEIAGGYSMLHTQVVAPSSSFNLQGGSAAIAVNVNRWLGVVGDFGFYSTKSIGPSGFGLKIATYTFGPQISYRRFEHFTLFGHALMGMGHAGGTLYTVGFAAGSAAPGPVNAFALAAGGGLDYNITRNFALRAFQGEWLYTQFPNGASNRQNYLRMTFGAVFRFGS